MTSRNQSSLWSAGSATSPSPGLPSKNTPRATASNPLGHRVSADALAPLRRALSSPWHRRSAPLRTAPPKLA